LFSFAAVPALNSRRGWGLYSAFVSLGAGFIMLYISIRVFPLFIFPGAILMGFGHSLSNIELRTVATANDPAFPLSVFTVYSFIGWFLGVLIVGISSCYSGFAPITLTAATVSCFLIFTVVKKFARKEPKKPADEQPQIYWSPPNTFNKNITWIWIGVFLNSMQVTLFNASIVVFIKSNLKLSNVGLSLVLGLVFFSGLILLLPSVAKRLGSLPQTKLWQAVQSLRLIATFIVLTTTALWVALLALPVFGLLMNMGSICQLGATRTMIEKERQKLAHSLTEIAAVAGGVAVTALSAFGMAPAGLIAVLAFLLLFWFASTVTFKTTETTARI
ncbi:MAG: hypothetical protein AAB359_01560, partial [Elusimicrobiota bacterium]